jgi:benzil reductase ((S)-benzoin forming)
MKVFVTGVSKGLGRAIANYYLNSGITVVGIGRSHDFEDPNFSFIYCDLSDPMKVEKLDFSSIDDEVIFINNAGILGNIQRLTDQENPDSTEVMNVNAIAPMLLSRSIARAVSPDKTLTIINISSGAGRRAIPSWASYCASKAALDRFSETFLLEEREKGRIIKVFSVAPGVIDTSMQEKIRNSSSFDFSSVERFIELKNNGELRSETQVVKALMELIKTSNEDSPVVCSL